MHREKQSIKIIFLKIMIKKAPLIKAGRKENNRLIFNRCYVVTGVGNCLFNRLAVGRAVGEGAGILQADRDVADAQRLHRVVDRPGQRAAQRHDGNDGGDADDDAQHGQDSAHLVGPEAGQRHADVVKQSHARHFLSARR